MYGPHRQKGIERSRNPDVKAYVDYRELLADKNVDAVVIGTPDHWHCQMVLDAAKAGKDIYCEKGFSHTLPEAKRCATRIKQSRIVFQLGHHARQSTAALQAKELIAQGILGPITLVRTGRFMSSDPAHPMWRWYGYYSQWNRPDPAQVVKEVNWDLWLGPAPKIPWNERHFWHWRCYWAYGTGQAGDLLSHEMDFVQYLLGHGIPDTCYCAGLNALLNDDREVPDTWVATYQFEKLGRTVTFTGSMNTNAGQPVEICGKEATLRFDGIAHDVQVHDHSRGLQQPQGHARGIRAGQDPGPAEPHGGLLQLRPQPRHAEMPDRRGLHRNCHLPDVGRGLQAMCRVVRWDPVREEIVS